MTQYPHERFQTELNAVVDASGLTTPQLGRIWAAQLDEDPRVLERKWRRWQQALPPSVVHLVELLDGLGLKLTITRR